VRESGHVLISRSTGDL